MGLENDKLTRLVMSELTSRPAEGTSYHDDDMLVFYSSGLGPLEQAFKTNEPMFFYCIKGKLSLNVNGENMIISEADEFVVPSSATLTDLMASSDLVYLALFVSDNMLKRVLGTHIDLWNRLFYVDKLHLVHVGERSQKSQESVFHLFVSTLRNTSNPLRRDALHLLIGYVILGITGQMLSDSEREAVPEAKGSSGGLFNRFLEMLSREEPKRHPVKYYADKLFITPKYLSYVCDKESGKTALQWIQENVNSEIVYWLGSTNENIKDIAYKCGFPNPSAFCKHVKDNFGKSPVDYRESVRK